LNDRLARDLADQSYAGSKSWDVPRSEIEVIHEEEDIGQLRHEIGRLQGQRRIVLDQRLAFSRRVSRCERALQEAARNGGVKFHPVLKVEIKGKLPDAIEAERKKLAELHAERAEVISAPQTSSEAKRLASQWVEQLASDGAPIVAPLIEDRSSDVIVGTKISSGLSPLGVHAGVEVPDAIGLLAWLLKDQLTRALHKEIDKVADDKAALSDEDQRSRLAELDAAILACERGEEAMVGQALEQGLDLLPRGDSDPRAILGLSDDVRVA
jgi:hypothetical protein